MNELCELIQLEAQYQRDMLAWENTWWGRAEYAIHLWQCEVPADGQPLPADAKELLWFCSDWCEDEPRTTEQRIADLVLTRNFVESRRI